MSLSQHIRWRRWKLEGRLARWLGPLLARRLRPERDVQCAVETHGQGTAAYVVCPLGLGADSVVYSCGVGNDVSFDRSLIARHGLTLQAFDPTPQSAAFVAGQALPPQFRFHPWAVADRDGPLTLHALRPSPSPHYLPATVLDFNRPESERWTVRALRLSTIMTQLGHRRIDLLKLDIEGAEYGVLDDLLREQLDVRQIVLEFHPHLVNLEHHRWMLGRTGWQRTRDAIDGLHQAGYLIFHVSDRGTDLSLIRPDALHRAAQGRAA